MTYILIDTFVPVIISKKYYKKDLPFFTYFYFRLFISSLFFLKNPTKIYLNMTNTCQRQFYNKWNVKTLNYFSPSFLPFNKFMEINGFSSHKFINTNSKDWTIIFKHFTIKVLVPFYYIFLTQIFLYTRNERFKLVFEHKITF